MTTIVCLAAILFVAVGTIFILRRDDLARAQSLVAGGRLGAGCAVAEGIRDRVVTARGDVSDQESMERVLGEHEISTVFHSDDVMFELLSTLR